MSYLKQLRITLLILLTFSLLPAVSVGQNPTSNFVSTPNIFDTPFDTSQITTQSNLGDIDFVQDFVIFAKNKAEYDIVTASFDYKKAYPNLFAVRTSFWNSMYPSMLEIFPQRVAPASVFDQVTKFEASSDLANNPQINPNGDPDADIMHVRELWNKGYNGTGVKVAVFDNGILSTHPGLIGQVNSSIGFNTDPDGVTWTPSRDHGTPVAGTIAATGNGTGGTGFTGNAPGAKLVDMFLGSAQDGTLRGDTLAGFDWVITQNNTLNVINTSFGIPGLFYWFYDPVVQRLSESNILLVASAGNNDSPDPEDDVVVAPATSVDALAVGAITYAGSPTGFSAVGPTAVWLAKPDVLAPGDRVITTLVDGSYGPISGTSFSSPLTAGAIATLISALDANNIPWNVGTLKTAIVQTASKIGFPEEKAGQGIVNATAAWELLNSVVSDSNGPKVVEITPKAGPYDVFQRLISDIQISLDFSMFSSHPGDVSFSITGNLATIASVSGQDNNDYFQIVQLDIDTTGVSPGIYTGDVIATVGNNTSSATFTFDVQEGGRGKALLDLYHTNWDDAQQDKVGGSNIGEMIEKAKDLGIWVQEEDQILTPSLLAQYDILWMPDPLSLPISNIPIGDQSLPLPLLQSEIDAIVDFVNNGGSLFIDFNGAVTFTDGSTGGTNVTGINLLTTNFGITARDTNLPIGTSVSFANTNNISSPVGSTTRISHVGTLLDVTGTAKALSTKDDGSTVAIQELGTGGRVLVSTTNFWLDNLGALGLYSNGGAGDDAIFSRNTWNWLISDYGIKEISSIVDDTHIEASFEIYTNNSLAVGEPVVRLNPHGDLLSQIITPTKNENVYSFSFDFVEDGFYEIQVVWGDQYLSYSKLLDQSPPSIVPTDSNANFTGFSGTSTLFLRFETSDLNPLVKNDFYALLDGVTSADVTVTGLRTDIVPNLLTVSVSPNAFTATNPHWYILTVGAIDLAGNNGSINLWFYIGGEMPELPPDAVVTSDEPSTTVTSTTTTTTPTSTTSSVPSSSTPSSSAGNGDSPFNSTAMIFAIVGLFIVNSLFRKKKT